MQTKRKLKPLHNHGMKSFAVRKLMNFRQFDEKFRQINKEQPIILTISTKFVDLRKNSVNLTEKILNCKGNFFPNSLFTYYLVNHIEMDFDFTNYPINIWKKKNRKVWNFKKNLTNFPKFWWIENFGTINLGLLNVLICAHFTNFLKIVCFPSLLI